MKDFEPEEASDRSRGSQRVWALAGKIAMVLGVIYTAMNIIDRIRTPGPDVVVTVRSSPYVLPPSLAENLAALVTFKPMAQEPEILATPRFYDDKKDKCFSVLQRDLEKHLGERAERLTADLRLRSTYLSYLELRNEGDRTAANVSLRLPDSPQMLFVRANGQERSIKPSDFIELGSLRPNEAVEFFCWMPYELSPAGRGARVFYDNGTGSVFYSTTYRGVLALVIRWWDLIPLAAFLLLLSAAISALLVAGSRAEQRKRPSQQSNDTESDEAAGTDA